MREKLFSGPEIPAEDKILFWMVRYKETSFALQQLVSIAQAALDAYEDRFESTTGQGNYLGPIDEEMKKLREALEYEAALRETLAKEPSND